MEYYIGNSTFRGLCIFQWIQIFFSSETKMLTWNREIFHKCCKQFIVENFRVRLFFLNSFRSIVFSLKFCDTILLTEKYFMIPGKQTEKNKQTNKYTDTKMKDHPVNDFWLSLEEHDGLDRDENVKALPAPYYVTSYCIGRACDCKYYSVRNNIHAMTFYCVSRTLKMMWAPLLPVDDVMIQSDIIR